MSHLEMDNRARCPSCGFGALLTEECYVCSGRAPACRCCQGTGVIKTCPRCGADFWKAQRRAQAIARHQTMEVR